VAGETVTTTCSTIGIVVNSDGGWSWTNPQTGTTLQTPIDASQTGPSYHPLERSLTKMTPERCIANWLSGFLYKNSRILMALYSYDKSAQHGATATIPSQAVPGGARIVVLVSHDLGNTWRDYAASDVLPNGPD
jgi:hypothetical protein